MIAFLAIMSGAAVMAAVAFLALRSENKQKQVDRQADPEKI